MNLHEGGTVGKEFPLFLCSSNLDKSPAISSVCIAINFDNDILQAEVKFIISPLEECIIIWGLHLLLFFVVLCLVVKNLPKIFENASTFSLGKSFLNSSDLRNFLLNSPCACFWTNARSSGVNDVRQASKSSLKPRIAVRLGFGPVACCLVTPC